MKRNTLKNQEHPKTLKSNKRLLILINLTATVRLIKWPLHHRIELLKVANYCFKLSKRRLPVQREPQHLELALEHLTTQEVLIRLTGQERGRALRGRKRPVLVNATHRHLQLLA